MYLRPIRFIGNKHHFITHFLELEKELHNGNKDDWNYVEPFIGSGSIFLNKNFQYKNQHLNDKDSNLIRIWKSLQDFDIERYDEARTYVEDNFGNIKMVKESWYNFRNWANKTYWKTDSFEEGIYLLMLANSTINSIFRFGPNGFNSSYGNRFTMPTVEEFTTIKERLRDVRITDKDYTDCLVDVPNTLYFIDPPYYTRYIQSYVENFETLNVFKEFLERVKSFKHAKVIYTDIINDVNKEYMKDWNVINVRDIRNIGPNVKNKNTTGNEVAFYNF